MISAGVKMKTSLSVKQASQLQYIQTVQPCMNISNTKFGERKPDMKEYRF